MLTLSAPALATARSGLLSLLKSPTATDAGYALVGKLTWGAKLGEAAPAGVVFSSTLTLFAALFTTARSGRPSPSRSLAAKERGPAPVGKLTWGAKLGEAAPAGVVFSSTLTLASL